MFCSCSITISGGCNCQTGRIIAAAAAGIFPIHKCSSILVSFGPELARGQNCFQQLNQFPMCYLTQQQSEIHTL